MKSKVRMLLAASALIGFATGAEASIIPLGSSLAFGGNDLPGACTDTSCSDAVTFSSTPVLIDGGALSLFETQVATGANGEWDVWHLSTVGGGPLAGDINGSWDILMNYVLSQPVIFDAAVLQWTVNGTPVDPLFNFGGIGGASASNPILSGEAYYNFGFSDPLPAGTQTGWEQVFVSPYNFVASGGIDPNTANGLNFANHYTLQTPVPEPGSLSLLGSGLLGLYGFAYRRRRKNFS